MYREVFAGRDAHVLTVGEMPGVTIRDAVLFTDPARHELDMVFQFQHVPAGHRREQVRPAPAAAAGPEGRDGGLADRFGRTRLEFPLLRQSRPASFGIPVRRRQPAHRVASAKTLATVLHLHRGTPYVYQGDELGMANTPFTAINDYRDIQALRFYAEAAERGGTDLPALLPRWPR